MTSYQAETAKYDPSTTAGLQAISEGQSACPDGYLAVAVDASNTDILHNSTAGIRQSGFICDEHPQKDPNTAKNDLKKKIHRIYPLPVQEADFLTAAVETRLKKSWPEALSNDEILEKDHLGQTVVKTTPPITRSSMVPEAWNTNPLSRVWRRFKTPQNKAMDTESNNEKDQWRHTGTMRRYLLSFLTLSQTLIATWYMKTLMPYQGWSLIQPLDMLQQDWAHSFLQILPYFLQGSMLILFSILFCWVSAGFWTALMGFLQLLIGRDKYNIASSIKGDEPLNPHHRTALVMPICNEDVARVFAGLRATWESLLRTGEIQHFDLYILSDSNDTDIIVSEQKAWMDLLGDVGGAGKIFYRRRRRRVNRKSGNIDDFCRRWGNQYSYMVVLDADSIMTGSCLTSLVRIMEKNPKAGIVQTSPKACGMNTFHARCQQFATRVYGPLFTVGLHFWQLGESHYWGHNAIIRVKPFMQYCALAPLPGKGAFGGSILSHDFVEAALMRRAGFGVWIAYDLPGSYEALPPNFLDELKRDRRWCHGNLMNFKLFFAKGMHPVHRVVFLTGLMSYLSAPLWFMFLILTTALHVVHKLIEPRYFFQPEQLFPVWPQWHPELATTLFISTLVLLFLPKLFSAVLILCKGAKEYGGPLKLLISMSLEMLISVLLAPIRMLFHTFFIVSAFFGWQVVWKSPQRDGDSTSWSEAFRRHSSQLLLGVFWAISMKLIDVNFLWWLAPILTSLILSPVVSVISSRSDFGLKTRRVGLFLTPEESSPPKTLVDTENYLQENNERALDSGFKHALSHPSINALAIGMARSRHLKNDLNEQARHVYLQQVLAIPPEVWNEEQRLTLLNDPVLLTRIYEYRNKLSF